MSIKRLCIFISVRLRNVVLCAIYLYLWCRLEEWDWFNYCTLKEAYWKFETCTVHVPRRQRGDTLWTGAETSCVCVCTIRVFVRNTEPKACTVGIYSTNLCKKVLGKKCLEKKPGNKNFGKKSEYSQVLGKNVTGNKVLCFEFLELFFLKNILEPEKSPRK